MKNKLDQDLAYINAIQYFCSTNNWLTVVYGGYGMDFYFGKISRDHGDIDIVVYGLTPRNEAITLLVEFLKKMQPGAILVQSYNEFQIEIDLKKCANPINLYYVQTAEPPQITLQKVVKADGSIATNNPADFPPPKKVNFYNHEYLVQDQLSHLREITAKGGQTNPKYVSDIALLSQVKV